MAVQGTDLLLLQGSDNSLYKLKVEDLPSNGGGGGDGTVTGVSADLPLESDDDSTNPTLSVNEARTQTAADAAADDKGTSGVVRLLAEGTDVAVGGSGNTAAAVTANLLQATNSNVSTNASSISSLETDVDGLETDVGNLQTDVGDLQTDLDDLESDVSTNATDISNLQTDVGNLQTDVGNIDVGVTQIIAGTQISIDPAGGAGEVTINSTADTLVYRGTVDVTVEKPAATTLNIVQDLFINTGSGTFHPTWAAVTTNATETTEANPGDFMIYNQTDYDYVATGSAPSTDSLWVESDDIVSPVNTTATVQVETIQANTYDFSSLTELTP